MLRPLEKPFFRKIPCSTNYKLFFFCDPPLRLESLLCAAWASTREGLVRGPSGPEDPVCCLCAPHGWTGAEGLPAFRPSWVPLAWAAHRTGPEVCPEIFAKFKQCLTGCLRRGCNSQGKKGCFDTLNKAPRGRPLKNFVKNRARNLSRNSCRNFPQNIGPVF